MIRGVLKWNGHHTEFSDLGDDIRVPLQGCIWIDILDQQRDDLDLLGSRFGFHPLALEDCEHLDQRPKLEEYGNYVFIVLHSFREKDDENDLTPAFDEIHIFLSREYMITVHKIPIPGLDTIWNQAMNDVSIWTPGIDFLFYRLVDRVVDEHFPMLFRMEEEITEIEAQLLEHNAPSLIGKIVSLKRNLLTMRRVMAPEVEVFEDLLRHGCPIIAPDTRIFVRDVHDHLLRLLSHIQQLSELLANARDAHFSALSVRTNEIMKRLTLMSLVFLPLTFLTGFFGMNFVGLPFNRDELMYMVLIVTFILPLTMTVWFRYKRWFN